MPFDKEAVGLRLLDPEDAKLGLETGRFLRDGRRPGDQPRGHPFGTELMEGEKRDLIAYLRRL